MVDPRKMAPPKESIRQRDRGVAVIPAGRYLSPGPILLPSAMKVYGSASPFADAIFTPRSSYVVDEKHVCIFDASTQVAPGRLIFRTWLPDGEVEGSTVHELAGEVRQRGYLAESFATGDGAKVLTWWDRAATSSEARSHEPLRYYREVDPVKWDEMVNVSIPGSTCSIPMKKDFGAAPAHSPSGPCAKCEWPYCRVPAVRAEPAARCAACGLGTPTSNFEGGGCFDYPLHADGSCPDNADAAGGNGVEEQPLCPTCAEKVAKFISHLRATHGGRR